MGAALDVEDIPYVCLSRSYCLRLGWGSNLCDRHGDVSDVAR